MIFLAYVFLSYFVGFIWLIIMFSIYPDWNDDCGPGPITTFILSPCVLPFVIPFMTAKALGLWINRSKFEWKEKIIKAIKESK